MIPESLERIIDELRRLGFSKSNANPALARWAQCTWEYVILTELHFLGADYDA